MSAEPSSLAVADAIQPEKKGVAIRRFFTDAVHHPFELVHWERRIAKITGSDGAVVFEQENVEVPDFWSETATNIVAQKYFHGRLGTPEREFSVKQLIGRVVETIVGWAREGGFVVDEESRQTFDHELAHLLLHQMASFNSPVWFNVGTERHPQCSACFINSVKDSMESILDLAKTEGMLFKFGSGTGSNLSVLRSSRETLTGGGTASGPVSFMRGFDSFAGVIKSGGKTRRAAKMVILNVDHPDIAQFIKCKAEEEKKAHALIAAGYPASFDQEGGAYESIQYQNANHTVRVTEEFMRAVEDDGWWETRAVTNREVMSRHRARDIMHIMGEATWVCGDPGIQYDSTINRWHTCKNSGRINASNPCSEYMFLDDTACNLSSLNVLRFVDSNGDFQCDAFRHAVDIMILAQEILVDASHYPTPKIAANSHDFRPLGLGYANLGALLMAEGLPYDSVEGRSYAAAITALMCGEAYLQSARIAQVMGPFPEYQLNREPMIEVITMHRDAAHRLPTRGIPANLRHEATHTWDEALDAGRQWGYRNAQVTVLAPTGTISFMMDCDTTGIEPEFALVKVKRLVGGGSIKIVNQTVPRALVKLGYDEQTRTAILKHIESTGTIEGAPGLLQEHLPVFDCAFKAMNGTRFISPLGHLTMMGAAQPFLSGAISKTVNVPETTTPEEIDRLYMEGWRLGLKAIAVYRDNCKGSQPLAVVGERDKASNEFQPVRRKLPDERVAITHKFSVEGQEGYVTVGLYEDGTPGELFITMAKEGSTLSGVMDAFATAISLTLQYGVPLEFLVNKFSHVRFEPSGWTNNPQIPYAKSIIDYIFRWLASKFLAPEEQAAVGVQPLPANEGRLAVVPQLVQRSLPLGSGEGAQLFINQADAPPCPTCGMVMVRNGSCYKCTNCGTVHGCS